VSLSNRKVVITGGPTREWLDPVRYISNPSSGKMGISLADESFNRGYSTVFIHGTVDSSLLKDKGYRMVSVETTDDLLTAVLNEINRDVILIMAAAPVDYSPIKKSETKIKKEEGELLLRLKKNPDILKSVAIKKEKDISLVNLFVVGFAAETDNVEEYALKKLRDKKLDMICLNDVSRKDAGFGTETNVVTIFTKNGEKIEFPLLSKKELSSRILNCIEANLV